MLSNGRVQQQEEQESPNRFESGELERLSSASCAHMERYHALREAGLDESTATKYSVLYSTVNEVIDALLAQSLSHQLAMDCTKQTFSKSEPEPGERCIIQDNSNHGDDKDKSANNDNKQYNRLLLAMSSSTNKQHETMPSNVLSNNLFAGVYRHNFFDFGEKLSLEEENSNDPSANLSSFSVSSSGASSSSSLLEAATSSSSPSSFSSLSSSISLSPPEAGSAFDGQANFADLLATSNFHVDESLLRCNVTPTVGKDIEELNLLLQPEVINTTSGGGRNANHHHQQQQQHGSNVEPESDDLTTRGNNGVGNDFFTGFNDADNHQGNVYINDGRQQQQQQQQQAQHDKHKLYNRSARESMGMFDCVPGQIGGSELFFNSATINDEQLMNGYLSESQQRRESFLFDYDHHHHVQPKMHGNNFSPRHSTTSQPLESFIGALKPGNIYPNNFHPFNDTAEMFFHNVAADQAEHASQTFYAPPQNRHHDGFNGTVARSFADIAALHSSKLEEQQNYMAGDGESPKMNAATMVGNNFFGFFSAPGQEQPSMYDSNTNNNMRNQSKYNNRASFVKSNGNNNMMMGPQSFRNAVASGGSHELGDGSAETAASSSSRPTNLMAYKGLWVCNVSTEVTLAYLKRRFRRFGHFTGIQTFERRATNGSNIVFVHYDNPYSPIEAIAVLHNYTGQDLCADSSEPLKLRFAPSMEQSRAGPLPTLEQARKIVERSGECFNWRLSSGCHRGARCQLKHITINKEIDSQPWVKALKKKILES